MIDEHLRWVSAVEQRRLLDAGEVTAAELRELAVTTIERLNPTLAAVVIPLFDRPGDGVPMLLKDACQEAAGTPHWCGVAALRDAGVVSTRTTELAARFEASGFTVIGKAACPELSTGATCEPPGFAPTRNPWDPSLSPGGSSGGSAAAVASGMVPIAHGSDGTGSLRCPAALCGVATLKPTFGRMPSNDATGRPAASAWCEYVLSRHVEDLVAVLGEVAPPRAMRVGVLDHDPERGLPVDADCAEAARATGRLLESLGHHVDVAWPSGLRDLWARAFPHFVVIAPRARADALAWVAERLGRPVRRGDVSDELFDMGTTAVDEDAVIGAGAALAREAESVVSWWDDFDVLVTPTTFKASWPLGGNPGPAEMGTLLAPFSFTGQPAVSLPVHWTAHGMPVGTQLVARRGEDAVLLRLALDLQEAADWRWRRPVVS